MLRPGDRVLAPRAADPHLYPGIVQDADRTHAAVSFDDGEEARVPAAEARPLALAAGDRVLGRLPATRTYTPAVATRRDGDRLSVEFEDGGQEWTSLGMVRIDPKNWKGQAPRPQGYTWIV